MKTKIYMVVLALTISVPANAGNGNIVLEGSPSQKTLSGNAKVIDGDTLQIDGEKIQLYGVDAPELGYMCNPIRVKWTPTQKPIREAFLKGAYSPETELGIEVVYVPKDEVKKIKATVDDYPQIDAGIAAKAFLEKFIDGRPVFCEAEWESHGLLHGLCYAGKQQTPLNYWMLKTGYAKMDRRDAGFRALDPEQRPFQKFHPGRYGPSSFARPIPGLRGIGYCAKQIKIPFNEE